MSDLRSFVILQARLYEFLGQQDGTTLQGIVSGTVRLTILPTSGAEPHAEAATSDHKGIPVRSAPPVPSSDPYQAAQDLAKLPSEHERRIYLNASGLNLKQLQSVAKMCGLKRYSRLSKPQLIEELASHGSDQTPAVREQPRPSPAGPIDDHAENERPATAEEARPSPVARPTETEKPDVDAAAVASRLREIETEEEGATYLRAQGLSREGLLAVAAELQLTRVNRLKPSELEKRVLKQAIGARRKFAGLRNW